MTKIVTAHQPNYIPWIGFFSKVASSDCLIFLDCVDFNRRGFTHRNKIRVNGGWAWLTVPVSKIELGTPIRDVGLPSNSDWMLKHWKTIERNYKKAAYFDEYCPFFEEVYKKEYAYLYEFNVEIIKYLLDCFDVDVDIIFESQLDIPQSSKKTSLIVDMLDSIDATKYLSGPSGRDYLDDDVFLKSGISIEYFDFVHPTYKQRYPGFEPFMASIDLLFNEGDNSAGYIHRGAMTLCGKKNIGGV